MLKTEIKNKKLDGLQKKLEEKQKEIFRLNNELGKMQAERKSVEKILRQAELKYRTIADFTFDWIHWMNEDGSFQYVSPSCERISGYTAREFIEKPSLFRDIIIPEDLSLWDQHRHDPQRELKSQLLQFRIRHKNSEIKWIEHACTEVKDADGTVLGIRASNRDITARKIADEKLRTSEENLSKAQQIAHLGNWNWNIVDNLLTWSDEVYRIFGLLPQQFGATYDAFLQSVHPDDRTKVEIAVQKALADPQSGYHVQHRVNRPDGQERFVQERGEVTVDKRKRPVRMIGTVQDITELKAMQAESQQLRAELAHMDRVGTIGTMVSAIAHEINQPLTAILSNSQASQRFLQTTPPDMDEILDALSDIESDAKRAGEIIQRIRSMVRKEKIRQQPYNINAGIKEVLELVHSETIIRNVKVTAVLDESLPNIYVDRIQIQQVFLNLIMNALDAVQDMPQDNRQINISTHKTETYIITTITDTGSGIEPDKINKVFDPFYTTKQKGMGIGLSLCQSIIVSHGGQISVDNGTHGGTKFWFSLPIILQDNLE